MKKRFRRLAFVVILLALSSLADAGEAHHPSAKETVRLSNSLALLMRQEMAAIQEGMMQLVPALASGQWHKIAEIGEAIRDTYILKRKLTPAQVEELQQALPPSFIEIDEAFHESAGKLAQAAKMSDVEVLTFYFYKLADACVTCHRRYATGRFPGFASPRGHTGHQH